MTLGRLRRIALVGAGKMGGALFEGWIGRGLAPDALTLIDPSPPADICATAQGAGVRIADGPHGLETVDILVLAVKPQIMAEVLKSVAEIVGPTTLVISIAAGQTIADIEAGLDRAGPVVRAMPNTPASIGRGISVLVANEAASEADRVVAGDLMASVGAVEWIDDEELMDAVTAVSGSGPAYVFHLAETLAEAGRQAGLDAGLAERLARSTIAGSGALLEASDLPASTLRENVTSPGGTTAAALGVLMGEGGLASLMERTVAAATKRGRELAG